MPATDKLTIVINADIANSKTEVEKLTRTLEGLSKKTETASERTESLKNALKAVAAVTAAAAAGFVALAAKGIKNAAAMEQNAVAFDVLLGSAEKSKAMIAQLEKFAQVTPFVEEEVMNAGKALAGFGIEADAIIPTLQRLGDVASMTNQRSLKEMAVMFGKLSSSGVAMAQDLNQLSDAGIPIMAELAKVYGLSGDSAVMQIKKMASESKITAHDVETALMRITSAGGKGFGMMEKQSKTLAGLWSTFTSVIDTFAMRIGQGLSPVLKDVLSSVLQYQGAFKDLGTAVGEIAGKALKIFVQIITDFVLPVFFEIIQTIKNLIGMWNALGEPIKNAIKIITLASAAVWLFNAALAANPIFLIIGAIALLVYGLTKLYQHWEIVRAAANYAWNFITDKIVGAAHFILATLAGLAANVMWVIAKMFEPWIAGINIVIKAFNNLSGKSIPLLKNIAAEGYNGLKQWQKAEEDRASAAFAGTMETKIAYADMNHAIEESNRKKNNTLVKDDENANKLIVDSSARATKKIKDQTKEIVKTWEQRIQEGTKGISGIFSQVSAGMNILSDIMKMAFEGVKRGIEEAYDAQIKKEEEALQNKLRAEGLIEETTVERLNKEISALARAISQESDMERAAAMQAELIEKQKELRKIELTQASADAIAAIEQQKQDEIKKLAYDAAVFQKAMMIAQATISGFSAVVQALTLPPPAGPIAAGIIGALVATQIGFMIAEPIPAAAQGALIRGSAAGTLIRAGENNRSEMIVPFENPEVMDKVGGMGGSNINVYIDNIYGSDDIPDKVAQAFDKALFKLRQDGNSRFARA